MSMNSQIRPFTTHDIHGVVELSLLANKLVFTSWEKGLGADRYLIAIYRD
jgi:hypothetical protein